MNEERELKGPNSYEKYNKISILCQKRYFKLFQLQILLLILIAFISLFPPFPEKIEIFKHFFELLLIILVLIIMILQYKSNYMEGWQNARYLAESILSNAWLFVWKCAPFNSNQNDHTNFINIIERLEKEVSLKPFLSLAPDQDDEISDWMNNFRDSKVEVKKNNYIKYRLNDQINWYFNKASFNQKRSTQLFIAGLSLMGIGAILTIGIIIGIIPNWTFLGFFTTTAVSVFSWSQAKRNDELKITYGVSAQELSRFKSKMNLCSNENELIELVEDTEKAISREHKLWLAGSMS